MNLDESLRDKQIMNGPFADTADLSQSFKFLMRRGANWERLPTSAKEALELIASHVGKVLHGDHSEPKHWNDIATLARLQGKLLEPLKMPTLKHPMEAETYDEQIDLMRANKMGTFAVLKAVEDQS